MDGVFITIQWHYIPTEGMISEFELMTGFSHGTLSWMTHGILWTGRWWQGSYPPGEVSCTWSAMFQEPNNTTHCFSTSLRHFRKRQNMQFALQICSPAQNQIREPRRCQLLPEGDGHRMRQGLSLQLWRLQSPSEAGEDGGKDTLHPLSCCRSHLLSCWMPLPMPVHDKRRW